MNTTKNSALTTGAAAAYPKEAKTIASTARQKPNSKGKYMKTRTNKTQEAILFGEDAAHLVGLQIMESVTDRLADLWREACEGGSDGGGWDDAHADASITLQITCEEAARIQAEVQAGADTHRLVGGLSRLMALLVGVQALRPDQDDYSSRALKALPQELVGLSNLAEHVAFGLRFAKAEGPDHAAD